MSLTIKRLIAYLFDVTVVSLVASLISTTTINPNYEKRVALNDEYGEKMKAFQEEKDNLDESNEEEVRNYLSKVTECNNAYILESNKAMVFENGLQIVLLFLYFVVFAYFFDGETVGKRLVKIKVVKKDNKRVGFGNLVVRLIVLHGVPFVIVNSALAFVMNESSYFILNSIIYLLTLGLEIAILATSVAGRENRGLHDMIAGTKVVDR